MQNLHNYLLNFTLEELDEVEGKTDYKDIELEGHSVSVYSNEFWTSKQRQASSIHEISYRACFKPQLPRFFITILTNPGDLVYDPFSGRGTTPVEASLLGRRIITNDINPLSEILTKPRLEIPDPIKIQNRLDEIDLLQ
ncbi:MAG: DNA methyltransferase, partial [Promethearchaeota archaeon]